MEWDLLIQSPLWLPVTIKAKLNDHAPKRICCGLRFTGLGRSLLENEHKIRVWKALRPLSGLWEGSPLPVQRMPEPPAQGRPMCEARSPFLSQATLVCSAVQLIFHLGSNGLHLGL